MATTSALPTAGAAMHARCVVIDDITIAYGRRIVLAHVNADIPQGQVVSLVGSNGTGKSTLLKAIAGLLPLAAGEIRLFDEPIAKMRQHVAYVPQREDVDWSFPVSVRDVVLMGRYPRRGWLRPTNKDDDHAVVHALEQMGIASIANRQISELSGGQQRRAFIARAIVQEAQVILLDEPMAGIDAETHDRILELFDEWQAEGKVVLQATHAHAHSGSVIALRRHADPIPSADLEHHVHEAGEHHGHRH